MLALTIPLKTVRTENSIYTVHIYPTGLTEGGRSFHAPNLRFAANRVGYFISLYKEVEFVCLSP